MVRPLNRPLPESLSFVLKGMSARTPPSTTTTPLDPGPNARCPPGNAISLRGRLLFLYKGHPSPSPNARHPSDNTNNLDTKVLFEGAPTGHPFQAATPPSSKRRCLVGSVVAIYRSPQPSSLPDFLLAPMAARTTLNTTPRIMARKKNWNRPPARACVCVLMCVCVSVGHHAQDHGQGEQQQLNREQNVVDVLVCAVWNRLYVSNVIPVQALHCFFLQALCCAPGCIYGGAGVYTASVLLHAGEASVAVSTYRNTHVRASVCGGGGRTRTCVHTCCHTRPFRVHVCVYV